MIQVCCWIGPKTWVDVYQNCGGDLQSPINLGIDNAAVYSRTLNELGKITFSDGYKESIEGKLHNNGHTGKIFKHFWHYNPRAISQHIITQK